MTAKRRSRQSSAPGSAGFEKRRCSGDAGSRICASNRSASSRVCSREPSVSVAESSSAAVGKPSSIHEILASHAWMSSPRFMAPRLAGARMLAAESTPLSSWLDGVA